MSSKIWHDNLDTELYLFMDGLARREICLGLQSGTHVDTTTLGILAHHEEIN